MNEDKANDPDAWAAENKEMIQKMTWEDWLKLGKEYRKSTFMQFSTEQLLPFGLAKIEDAKSLDWNDGEMAHLNELSGILIDNAHWFDSKLLGENSETGKEMNRLIAALVMDGGKLMDKEGILDVVSSGCQGGACK